MGIMKNQTAARLVLQTNIDFNAYVINSQKIKYSKPDGSTGEWTANKLPTDLTLGKIYVDFSDVLKFDQEGTWTLSAYLVFSDNRTGIGENVKYRVEEGVSY